MSLFRNTNAKLAVGLSAVVSAAVFGIIWAAKGKRVKKMPDLCDVMEELQQSHVHIKDRARVEAMIRELVQGGKDKLQVIADFDRTLSKHRHDSQTCDTTHNALDESKVLPDSYRQEAVKIRDFYYAIEIDPSMTLEEKYPYMVEWWTKAHSLLVGCNLNKNLIKQIVRNSRIKLRDNVSWMFQQLHKSSVPCLVFSAGIGDIIEEVIQDQSVMYDNIKIVSNYMDFNHQGALVGFKGEMIHVFNKNECAIHKSSYFDDISHRENIILLGDSLGDLKMAHGAVEPKQVLKIGFLNDKIEERLQTYMDSFDIVLIDDETMDIANAIIKKIL